MKTKERVIKTDEEFKILADPYRMRILRTFQGNEEPMTVKQVADSMGEVPAKVHYHVKKLLSIDILELDYIKVINGINAKYYATTTESLKFRVREDLTGAAKAIQVDQITKVLLYTLDQFKNDIIDNAHYDKDLEECEENSDGHLTQMNVHLTKKEYIEFKNYTNEFIKDHKEKKESTTKYSTLIGLISKK
ncbi:hypothetical protein KQ51_00235 [Candidatus Izimaplasma bacterium HR1]|jgi:predicted transcriptional regulator|uniref:helix-turn-helix domain-containing protein n=1 Tax=Candidatus Izimoplasma sp. HR1 TaxID=1541959 RepID=UPI0004F5BB23|nr:hypothetical protein KQ51_00235 [Candidatus Izimaplasma bacterium HR1]